ncbi:hypothetical protein [Flaviaesturariibacter aridisoli]|uniref:Cytochrome B n=1 Tax=Flaviaesturariibacter aridisoli TaxID=2545761 RepID=A0A4R4DZL4_9BACT|nr:hypothetical protein [Flaviaesturariibacter aridisoli]TCZ70167.1 hypothetical protein E0486_11455 [Flaviaesturariibacter aridisoli]
MYNGLLHAHSGLRWVVFILLLLAIFRHATAGNKPYGRKNGLLLTIFADVMLLIGLYLWFAGAWGLTQIQNRGFGEVMKDPVARFFAVEHMVGMIVAIALLHVGKAQGKKNIPDRNKHTRALVFYVLSLLIMLFSIPWPFRAIGAGRGWF